MSTATTNDPTRNNYAPAYDERQECDRLVRCLQQQIEDCFATIGRIQTIEQHGPRALTWRTLREGLRCWRLAIRYVGDVG